MPRKHYSLSEKSLEILHQIMEERHIKTETAALEYVLLQHERQQKAEERFSQIIRENFNEILEGSRAAARAAEKNTQLLLDAMNALLIERGYRQYYSAEKEPSQILRDAEQEWKRKLEREKQVKDNRLQKRGGIK